MVVFISSQRRVNKSDDLFDFISSINKEAAEVLTRDREMMDVSDTSTHAEGMDTS